MTGRSGVVGAGMVFGVGAANGLGAALCRKMAAEGLTVFVCGRTPEKVVTVATQISAAGGSAVAVPCDVTDEASVHAAFARLDEAAAGPLEIVCYNAGNNQTQEFAEMEASFFESVWRVACFGGFLVGREAVKRMRPQARGTITFTGASASMRGKPPFAAFSAAKAGLRAMAQAMAREFGPAGIHVAHVVVDGSINGERIRTRRPERLAQKGEDGLLDIGAIVSTFWHLHSQHRTAWTQELDLRPYKEPF